jgi:hypothetical protein
MWLFKLLLRKVVLTSILFIIRHVSTKWVIKKVLVCRPRLVLINRIKSSQTPQFPFSHDFIAYLIDDINRAMALLISSTRYAMK